MNMRHKGLILVGLLAGLVLVGNQVLAGGNVELKKGDKAPAFESIDDAGKPFKSDSVVGKKVVVLFFYPASFTGGCTKQACSFRDDLQKLQDLGCEVIGISGDTAATQAKFKKEHKLGYTLLADDKGEVAKKFGVPVKAGGTITVGGEKITRGVSIARWTFVIDKQGHIAHIDSKVNPTQDSKKVQEVVKSLQK